MVPLYQNWRFDGKNFKQHKYIKKAQVLIT